jgi:hypothetical protein
MESGPEPQELFESVEHSKHQLEHEERVDRRLVSRAAITATIMAVLAALGSLLSGHAVNEAIIKQAQATDQWEYYQAQATKQHLFEGDGRVLVSLLQAGTKDNAQALHNAVKEFKSLSDKYGDEKEDLKLKAEGVEKQSEQRFSEHEQFSLAVACFQIAIVLASVSMMLQQKWLYNASLSTGIVGLIFISMGFMS